MCDITLLSRHIAGSTPNSHRAPTRGRQAAPTSRARRISRPPEGYVAPERPIGAFFVPRSDQKVLVTHQQKPSLEVLGVSENDWSKYRLVEIPLPRRATSQGRHPTCIAHPPGVGKRPRLVELDGWRGLQRGMRRRRGLSRPKSGLCRPEEQVRGAIAANPAKIRQSDDQCPSQPDPKYEL